MPLRRTVSGLAAATGLLFSLSACGDNDQTAPPPADSPATSSSTPSATPTPVDPTTAAKTKALADYQYFVTFWTKGKTSGNPAYPYDEVMTGEALKLTKSVATADDLRGIKATGAVKFLRGSVASVDLAAKPATARVLSCELDQITGVDKKGKQVYRPVGEISSDTTLALVGDRWKVTRKTVSGKDEGACAS